MWLCQKIVYPKIPWWSISSSTVCMSVNLGISLPVLDKPIVVPWFTLRQSNVAMENQMKFQLKFQFMGMFNDFQCHVWLPEGICQMGSTGPCSLSLKRFGHQPSSPRRGWRALGCRLTSGTYHPAVKVGGMFGHMRIWKLKDSKGFHWFPLFKLATGANSGPNVFNDNYWVSDFDIFW